MRIFANQGKKAKQLVSLLDEMISGSGLTNRAHDIRRRSKQAPQEACGCATDQTRLENQRQDRRHMGHCPRKAALNRLRASATKDRPRSKLTEGGTIRGGTRWQDGMTWDMVNDDLTGFEKVISKTARSAPEPRFFDLVNLPEIQAAGNSRTTGRDAH